MTHRRAAPLHSALRAFPSSTATHYVYLTGFLLSIVQEEEGGVVHEACGALDLQ